MARGRLKRGGMLAPLVEVARTPCRMKLTTVTDVEGSPGGRFCGSVEVCGCCKRTVGGGGTVYLYVMCADGKRSCELRCARGGKVAAGRGTLVTRTRQG